MFRFVGEKQLRRGRLKGGYYLERKSHRARSARPTSPFRKGWNEVLKNLSVRYKNFTITPVSGSSHKSVRSTQKDPALPTDRDTCLPEDRSDKGLSYSPAS